MAPEAKEPYRSPAFSQVLRLLEELNHSSRGSAIYQHIAEIFCHLESHHLETESQYIEIIEHLCQALSETIDETSPLQTELHILKSSLVPAMPSFELAHLNSKTLTLRQKLQNAPSTDMQQEPPENSIPQSDSPVPNKHPVFNHHLNETRNNIQRIKNKLNDQIDAAAGHNNNLAKLLKDSMEAVRLMDSKEHIDSLRLTYMRRYIQLFKEHQDLSARFDDIRNRLNEIESSSQYLDEELTRVHLMSFTDELTQLPNRRALMQRLADEVVRVQRYGGSLALAIVDLDGFKPINDQYGHDAGDMVLKRFAETALSVFRHHDTVARYGGEEFAILMPNTDIEGAMCALKKIQSQLQETSCRIDCDQHINCPTFSAGIALYSNGEAPEQLIKRADTAMYRAKHSGKNRIEIHTMGAKPATKKPQRNNKQV